MIELNCRILRSTAGSLNDDKDLQAYPSIIKVNADEDEKVGDLKRAIGTRMHVSHNDLQLAYRGAVLDDRDTLRQRKLSAHQYVAVYVCGRTGGNDNGGGHGESVSCEVMMERFRNDRENRMAALMQHLYRLVTAEMLAPLVEMGFSEERATKALLLNLLNTQLALEWLMVHADDPAAMRPITRAELMQIAGSLGLLTAVSQPLPEIQNAVDQGVCTYSITGNRYVPQQYQHCITCGLENGRGCCLACARICHRGHQLSAPVSSESFFCDCGSGDAPRPCRALQPLYSRRSQVNGSDSNNNNNRSSRGGGGGDGAPTAAAAAADSKTTTEGTAAAAAAAAADDEVDDSDARFDVFRERNFLSDSHVDLSSVVDGVHDALADDADRQVIAELVEYNSSDALRAMPCPLDLPDEKRTFEVIEKLTRERPEHVMTTVHAVIKLLSVLVLHPATQQWLCTKSDKGASISRYVIENTTSENVTDALTFCLNCSASSRRLRKFSCAFYGPMLQSDWFQQSFDSSSAEVRLSVVSILSNFATLAQPGVDTNFMIRSILTNLLLIIQRERNVLLLSEATCALGCLLVRCPAVRVPAISMDAKAIAMRNTKVSQRSVDVHSDLVLQLLTFIK